MKLVALQLCSDIGEHKAAFISLGDRAERSTIVGQSED